MCIACREWKHVVVGDMITVLSAELSPARYILLCVDLRPACDAHIPVVSDALASLS